MDLEAVRTFIAVADAGQFQKAAVDLALTQQAVSKRIAALERYLDVRLFARTPRGAELTIDGRVFLAHARELLRAERRASDSVRRGRRALRVDVIGSRLAPAALMRDFHRAHPELELEIVTHVFGAEAAIAAVGAGTIDASFRAVIAPDHHIPDEIRTARVLDEPLQLLTGPTHPLAAADAVAPHDLAGYRIWMPGNTTGTEWTAYYEHLAATFGFTIDTIGPNFGIEALLDVVADSSEVTTFVGEQIRLVWPTGHDLRRIALHDPTPVYPHALVWRADNPHPALAALRDYLNAKRSDSRDSRAWVPHWTPASEGP